MKQKDKKELAGKSRDELITLLKKKREELAKLRLDNSQKKLKNTRLLFSYRKDVAKILTLLREMELQHAENI